MTVVLSRKGGGGGGAPSSTVLPGARVTRTTNQPTLNATQTSLAFTSEVFDDAGFHDNAVNNSRLTVPAGMGGTYLIGGCVAWTGNATGLRAVWIELNGDTARNICGLIQEPESTASPSMALATLYVLAAGDFVELRVQQNSTITLDVIVDEQASPVFWIKRLSA